MAAKEISNSVLDVIVASSKADLVKMSREVVISQADLVEVIIYAGSNPNTPLRHFPVFIDHLPEDLEITEEHLDELGDAQPGDTVCMGVKLGQIFKQRRLTMAHAFHVEDTSLWCIFSFDFLDMATGNNHWKLGPHIHVVSSLTHPRDGDFQAILDHLRCSPPRMPHSIHFRFKEIERGPNRLTLRAMSSLQ